MLNKLFISRDGKENIPLSTLNLNITYEEDLKSIVTPAVFNRARELFSEKRVEVLKLDKGVFIGIVFSAFDNHFEIRNRNGKWSLKCDCSSKTVCSHITAAFLHLIKNRDHLSIFSPISLEQQHQDHADDYRNYWKSYLAHTEQIEKKRVIRDTQPQNKLVFFLRFYDNYWSVTPGLFYRKQDGNLGRNIPFTPANLRPEVSEIWSGERTFLFAAQSFSGNNNERTLLNTHSFPYFSEIGALFALLKDSTFFHDANLEERINVHPEPVAIEAEIKKNKNGYLFDLIVIDNKGLRERLTHNFKFLTINPVILYRNKTLYYSGQSLPEEFITPFNDYTFPLFIPQIDLDDFMGIFFRKYRWHLSFNFPEEIKIKNISELRKRRLYLHEEGEAFFIEMRFVYGDEEIELPEKPFQNREFHIRHGNYYFIERQKNVEKFWQGILKESGLISGRKGWHIPFSVNIYDWIFENLPELEKRGFEIIGEDKLRKYKINRSEPKIISSIESGLDWFDLHIILDFGGVQISWKDIRKKLRRKKNSPYVKLPDGSVGRLNSEIMKKLGIMAGFSQPESNENKLRFSGYHALLLEDFLSVSDQSTADRRFQNQLKKLKNFTTISEIAPSENFRGKLRTYQQAGLNWLGFLHDYNFGGCLADDMGLGKTVQTLSFLQKLHEKKKRTSLIVAPRSVVFNWEREIKRFTPNLKYIRYTGTSRAKLQRILKNYDLVITTYALLWRDFNIFSGIKFYSIVLDESQKIKNPASLTARSARKLTCNFRLALSGTPIENNTSELWSQFAFLNPGMLGSFESFRQNFIIPIEKEGSGEAARVLRKLIYPFVLRRTKETVEKDLPDKMENIIFCEMEEKQQALYNQWREYYRNLLMGEIRTHGLRKTRLQVLEGLTKLRQIAIHPALVDDRYRKSSGKLEALMEKINGILEEGHKILLYSQFVKMLKIVQKELEDLNVKFCYLDGRTRRRQEQIDIFQNDPEHKIFLISLRAGGLGLNLTAADYVIHIDPWWNPAVEDQATDRAHRIGQTRKVFVYRLITKDSVEEKIQRLQKSKKTLASELIKLDASIFKKLEQKDIENLFS